VWQTSNGNGNEEGDGDSNKGVGQAMTMAMKRVMATVTRVVGDEEGDGNSGKLNGNGNTGSGQVIFTVVSQWQHTSYQAFCTYNCTYIPCLPYTHLE
jgi:hypothetical protein